jgi:hypothetical protein
MALVIAIAVAAGAGLIGRLRWMFDLRQRLLFAAGWTAVIVAFLGLQHVGEQADHPLVHVKPLLLQWSLWLGVGGTLALAAPFGWWWLEQERQRAGSADLRRLGAVDRATLVLLALGGVLPLVGWVATIWLLWSSRAWTHREKLAASLALPGGPWVAVATIDAIVSAHWPVAIEALALLPAVSLLFVPAAAAVWLAQRARGRYSRVALTGAPA